MRIVVLDGLTLNPGNLSWQELERFGDCVIHERTPAALVAGRIAGADLVLTNKTPLDAAALAAAPGLRTTPMTAHSRGRSSNRHGGLLLHVVGQTTPPEKPCCPAPWSCSPVPACPPRRPRP